MAIVSGQRWQYTFPIPAGDFRVDEALCGYEFLPVLRGVDGRATGALRRYPGFRQLHQLTLTGTVDFFKYVEVIKESVQCRLRGFVVRHGTYLSFFYWDPAESDWYETVLDSASTGEIDVTFGSKFIFYAKSGTQGSAHWYDASANRWQSATTGYLREPPALSDVEDRLMEVDSTPPYAFGIAMQVSKAPSALFGYRFGNSKLGVWTPLVTLDWVAGTTASAGNHWGIRFTHRQVSYPSAPYPLRITPEEREFYDTLELYRTLDSGGNLYLESVFSAPAITGEPNAVLGDLPCFNSSNGPTYYDTVKWRNCWVAGQGDLSCRFILGFGLPDGTASLGGFNVNHMPVFGGGIAAAGSASDDRLMLQPVFDWDRQTVAPVPLGDRAFYSNGVLLKTTLGAGDGDSPGAIAYSGLEGLELGTFYLGNSVAVARASDKVERFLQVGGVIFGVTSGRLYALQNTGTVITGQIIHHGVGLLNRWAIAAIGETLGILGPESLYFFNSATGSGQTVGVVERILQDGEMWGNSRDNVFLAYDTPSQTLYIVNPDKEEALLLWGTTNTASMLVDCPFTHGTSGPHPETGGPDRAIFITPTGALYYPDTFREGAMAGFLQLVDDSYPGVDGTVQSPISGQTVIAYTALTSGSPAWGSGFSNGFDGGFGPSNPAWDLRDRYLYLVSTTGAVSRHRITAAGWTSLTVTPAVTAVVGDYWSISPVIFDIAGWPLGTDPDPRAPRDIFRRRRLGTIGASFRIIGGACPEALRKAIVTVRDNATDEPLVAALTSLSETPDACFGAVPISGPLLLPGVRVLVTDLDYALRGMVVEGTLEQTNQN